MEAKTTELQFAPDSEQLLKDSTFTEMEQDTIL